MNRSSARPSVPLVGVGASAGGLHALAALLDALPSAPGMAFAIVQHLAPDHPSELVHLLQQHTAMTVQPAEDGTRPEVNTVYVIPPGTALTIETGTLHLRPRPEGRLHPRSFPIDEFLRSLATDLGPDSVALILSGTGSDGTLGLKAVKEQGGLCLVQDPDEAEYDGMPRSAMATGLADVVSSVASLAELLASLRSGIGDTSFSEQAATALPDADDDPLHAVTTALFNQSGCDFRRYKPEMLLRRISRRMELLGLATLTDYTDRVSTSSGEAAVLLKDVLISVTNFFRDADAFQTLRTDILPTLLRAARARGELRIWVPGCATGEEAYSIAILVQEALPPSQPPLNVQIFATDLDEDALRIARRGIYPRTIAADVPADLLQRYFTIEGNGYRILPSLQEQILFAQHNLATDPPFSGLHLISCRNVLIYMNRDLQQDVFDRLRFALREDGCLFLGLSESPSGISESFVRSDAGRPFYRPSQRLDPQPPSFRVPDVRRAPNPSGAPIPSTPPSLGTLHEQLMLQRHTPPGVLVDADGRIAHITGDVRQVISVPPGPMTRVFIEMVPPELQVMMRSALYRALQQQASTSILHEGPLSFTSASTDADASPSLRVVEGLEENSTGETPPPETGTLDEGTPENGASDEEASSKEASSTNDEPSGDTPPRMRIIVEPVYNADTNRSYALVAFHLEPHPADWRTTPGHTPSTVQAPGVMESLEDELRRTQERYHTLREEYDTSTEELQTSNEELQSMNEELRSTTEELQVRKEELQSSNEELLTVNEELKSQIDETRRAHADLENLLASTDVATLFLTRDLRLKRYTPKALDLFDIQPHHLGVPLRVVPHRLQADLHEEARTVYTSLMPIRRRAYADGYVYQLSILPYRTPEDQIEGVVLTFVDVTEQAILRAARDDAEQESEMKSAMIANLSHEVRTPLTSLVGFSEVLRDEADSEDVQRFGDMIYRSSRRLQNTLESVLHFSRLEARKESTRHRMVNLSDELIDTMWEQRRVADAKSIALTLELGGFPVLRYDDSKAPSASASDAGMDRETDAGIEATVQADPDSIPRADLWCSTDRTAVQRILQNLTGNALKYTPDGGRVTLRGLGGTRGIWIEIEDTGIGMDTAFQARMYEPFSQASTGYGRHYEGIGLGLSIVKKLVTLIGATLEVESTPGHGTRFALFLPRSRTTRSDRSEA